MKNLANNKRSTLWCEYYQAKVNVPFTWFIGGVFRNEDNLVFERTFGEKSEMLEFFVTKDQEEELVDLLEYLELRGYVISFKKCPNRLQKL